MSNVVSNMKINDLGQKCKRLEADYEISNRELLVKQVEITALRAELEAAQRWIPVSEGLPEEGEVVWLWDGNNLGMGYYLVLTRQFMDRDTPLRQIKPTHWMPLPNPPEVEK